MVVERIEKMLGGTKPFFTGYGRVEAHETGDEELSFGDIAVLYRVNSQGDAITGALSRLASRLSDLVKNPIQRYFC
jgi:superfamily I DNA/RNA helicase